MVDRFYKKIRNKKPHSLREDFSGTFLFSCDWVKYHSENTALCVDIDSRPIKWGIKNNLSRLNPAQKKRITIKQADVLSVKKPAVDIVVAFNFSYWMFLKQKELKKYYQSVYRSLKKDGLFIMDSFGGEAAHSEQEEPRECDGFTYIWEHAKFYPLTSEMTCKIHFEFEDGSIMRNAFTYHWRLWSPNEVREILEDVGFSRVEFYWEGTDHKTGEGNGVFRQSRRGEAAECWIAYIIAIK